MKLIYLISRVILAWSFLIFLAYCETAACLHFCRYAQNVTNIEALPYPTTLPEFVPSHQSWAVTYALRDYAWTQKMLPSFVAIDMTDVYGDSHQHSNGTCAQIGWLSDTGYNTMDGQGKKHTAARARKFKKSPGKKKPFS